jgi:hypothetical protein
MLLHRWIFIDDDHGRIKAKATGTVSDPMRQVM